MDSVSHLLSDRGLQLVNSLPPYDQSQAEALSKKLRAQGFPADMVSAALTQQRLRDKGKLKFGDDSSWMLFTDAGYQQATRREVADLHARRYASAGCTSILDMTSGIGADSAAFARAGLRVTAVDIDPVTSACTKHNLFPYSAAQVICADALQLDLDPFDGVFVDPARRSARGRTFDPKDYTPALDRVLAIRESVPALGIKVAPGIDYSDLPADCHAQWISIDGSVVEAGLWFGPLADSPGRSAVVIKGGEQTEIETSVDPRRHAANVEPRGLGEFIYEPDGAVIRSGGVPVLAHQLHAAPVSGAIAYLTGDDLVRTPLATPFQVVASMPIKQLGAYLRSHNVGAVEILKRGVDLMPDQFRKTLKLKGDSSATAILTRLLGRHSAIVVERV